MEDDVSSLNQNQFADVENSTKKHQNQKEDRKQEPKTGTDSTCDLCSKKFSKPALLLKHKTRHNFALTAGTAVCTLATCTFALPSAAAAFKQLITDHEVSHVCPLCRQIFPFTADRDSCAARHTCKSTNQGFVCTACMFTCEDRRMALAHERSKHCPSTIGGTVLKVKGERSLRPKTASCNLCSKKINKRNLGTKWQDLLLVKRLF